MPQQKNGSQERVSSINLFFREEWLRQVSRPDSHHVHHHPPWHACTIHCRYSFYPDTKKLEASPIVQLGNVHTNHPQIIKLLRDNNASILPPRMSQTSMNLSSLTPANQPGGPEPTDPGRYPRDCRSNIEQPFYTLYVPTHKTHHKDPLVLISVYLYLYYYLWYVSVCTYTMPPFLVYDCLLVMHLFALSYALACYS